MDETHLLPLPHPNTSMLARPHRSFSGWTDKESDISYNSWVSLLYDRMCKYFNKTGRMIFGRQTNIVILELDMEVECHSTLNGTHGK